MRVESRTLMTIAAISALAVTTSAPGATAAPGGQRGGSPVGVWATQLDFGDGQTVHVWQQYTAQGVLCHEVRAEGVPHGMSEGTWRKTGPGRFRYAVTELFRDETGQVHGRAELSGTAVLAGREFDSSHSSKVYDADGRLVASGTENITFSRVTRAVPPCEVPPVEP
ncbi:hypothetical protein ACFWJ5_30890 [Streptomyces qaidamensis]|uniref:hypothetical protein n=1 Tax=Streptomyces qaidamensis TaxID=1783515 RepID=UPI0036681673